MSVKVEKDVVYDKDLDLKLDVYQDPTIPQKGALMDIHGGGWFRGDKAKDADISTLFAEHGYLVFTPNYRIAPKNTYPAAHVDIQTAVHWIQDSQYDFDRTKFGVWGSSAGGNLAAEMAIKEHLPAASWSGIFDIDDWLSKHQDIVPHFTQTQNFNQASAKIDQTGADDPFYKWFLLNYLTDDPIKIKDASLVHRIDGDTAPMLLANSMDEFVPNSGVFQMQEQLLKFNVPVITQFIPGHKHAKGYADQALALTLAFLDKEVGKVASELPEVEAAK